MTKTNIFVLIKPHHNFLFHVYVVKNTKITFCTQKLYKTKNYSMLEIVGERWDLFELSITGWVYKYL